MANIRTLGYLIFALLFFAGCISVYPPSPRPRAISFAPLVNPEIFSYEKSSWHETLTASWSPAERRHEIFALAFPSITSGEIVLAQYLKNKSGGKKKLIIVIPVIASTPFVGKHYAHLMTSWNGNADFNVLLLEDTKKLFYLDEMRRAATESEFLSRMRQTALAIRDYVVDVRRLIDWAEMQPEIDRHNIGIIGGSVGASLAVLVMAADPRIKAGVFDKGGGDWQKIFAESQEPALKKAREAAMKKFGWTKQELQEKISPLLEPLNPTLWAGRIVRERVLFLNAKNDSWLGRDSMESLWHALGLPERIEFKTGHKVAFAFSLTILGGHYADYKIYTHFRKNLK